MHSKDKISGLWTFPAKGHLSLAGARAVPEGKLQPRTNCDPENRRQADRCILTSSRAPRMEILSIAARGQEARTEILARIPKRSRQRDLVFERQNLLPPEDLASNG
jgi:hypothetical protein